MKLHSNTSMLGMSSLCTYNGLLDSESLLRTDSIQDDFNQGYIQYDADYFWANFDNKAYKKELIENLSYYLPDEIFDCLKKETFGKYISKVSVVDMYSPKEYNFESDSFGIDIKCNKKLLQELIKYAQLNSVQLSLFLKENYSSYDGFYSFTANNIVDLISDISEGRIQEVSAILRFIIEKDFGGNFNHDCGLYDKMAYMVQAFELYYNEFVDTTSLDKTINDIKNGILANDYSCSDIMYNRLLDKYIFEGSIKKVIQNYYQSRFGIEIISDELCSTYQIDFDFTKIIKNVFSEIDSKTLSLF